MAKKRAEPKSAVIVLLDHVWSSTNRSTTHSYERLNHAMRSALEMAAGYGFKFAPDDVQYILSNYRSHYWIGESDEWLYGTAVAAGNMSAIQSFEKAKGREPFIAEQVNLSVGHSGYLHGGAGTRQRERLVVGASFKWQGQTVKVTSFAKDQGHVNCCSYKRVKGGAYYSDKIDKRFKITWAELLEGRAFERERKALIQRFRAITDAAVLLKVSKPLRAERWDDLATVPLDKFRAMMDKHAPVPPKPPRSASPMITQDHIDRVLAARVCETARRIIMTYKAGQRASKIPKAHHDWLIRNCRSVAVELGFIEALEAAGAD
jgi:hypothetical protein